MTINLQFHNIQKKIMTDSFITSWASPFCIRQSTFKLQSNPNRQEQPKVLRNLILTAPPESQEDLDIEISLGKPINSFEIMCGSLSNFCYTGKIDEKNICFSPDQTPESKEDQDARVKGKSNKKGKRDGQNIRTYARYDSVIQALQEELSVHKIIPKEDDKKLLEQFEMKSKRSLERFFFYLLLAKRQNKLGALLPNLKLKIRAKIQQKGGHRTQEFLTSLQNCIQKYIQAAERLEVANNLEQARKAFSIAYLNDSPESGNIKRPHHNKIKGIDKCIQIYKIIMTQKNLSNFGPIVKHQQFQNINIINQQTIIKQQLEKIPECSLQKPVQQHKTYKKPNKHQDESYSVLSEQLLQNPNQKRKKVGVKNKKQDDRDIQKYAKFDIVSQSSLQFLKKQKLHKSIPQICKKLSQRSLHFFFVILAMIQKQKKDAQFLAHLQTNYEKKVTKRYTQRSQYFRERLYLSFYNLIQATRKLFQGNLQQALDIAYEVKADKKPHPAKASQQKKCRQIYEATRQSLEGSGNQYQNKLQSLIQTEKTHRSRLIKLIRPAKHNKQKCKIQIPIPISIPSPIIPHFDSTIIKCQAKTGCEYLQQRIGSQKIIGFPEKLEKQKTGEFFCPRPPSMETSGNLILQDFNQIVKKQQQ